MELFGDAPTYSKPKSKLVLKKQFYKSPPKPKIHKKIEQLASNSVTPFKPPETSFFSPEMSEKSDIQPPSSLSKMSITTSGSQDYTMMLESPDSGIDKENVPVTPLNTENVPQMKTSPVPQIKVPKLPKTTKNQTTEIEKPPMRSTRSGRLLGVQQNQILDFGQSVFGPKRCKECGMVYNASLVADKDNHRIYHAKAVEATLFPKQLPRSEVQVVESSLRTGHRIISINSSLSSRSRFYQKFIAYRQFIDEDLGSNVDYTSLKPGQKAFIFLNKNEVACGFILCSLMQNDNNSIRKIQTGEIITSRGFFVGVQVIWTYAPYRRKGIANQLLEIMRNKMIDDHYVSIDELAFSDTTEEGNLFATRYCQTDNYNVYQFRS